MTERLQGVNKMSRVLILSANPVLVQKRERGYYGAGWVEAFLNAMRRYAPQVKLAVAFDWRGSESVSWGSEQNGIIIYPLQIYRHKRAVLQKNLNFEKEATMLLPELQQAVKEFCPNVIHLFGSENPLGIICGNTEVPCAIHIQGFLPSCANAKYPPGMSKHEDIPSIWCHPFLHFWRKHLIDIYYRRAEREVQFLSRCQAIMGRTHWDKAIAELYAPQASYHHVSEMLRMPFIQNAGTWQPKQLNERTTYTIVSVISMPLFKGQDMILKTAKILTCHTKIKFQWNVYGIPWSLEGIGRYFGISGVENHVTSCGVVAPSELVEILQNADLFVLPSYIENSPNSLCEAQMLGLPCIATNVGGVSSLIENEITGLLVPANDPVMMANAIRQLLTNGERAKLIGARATERAVERHNPETVVADALKVYRALTK